MCCGLREHCEVYIYRPITQDDYACVYFAMADPFSPERVEAQGSSVEVHLRPWSNKSDGGGGGGDGGGGDAGRGSKRRRDDDEQEWQVAVSGISTATLLWKQASLRLEAEYAGAAIKQKARDAAPLEQPK